MIRKATLSDLDQVERCFTELLTYEQEHGSYTSWKLNIYPTRETAEQGLAEDRLYVMEQDGEICACMIASSDQPLKFHFIEWKYFVLPDEAMVIHLLCVRPSRARRGIGESMVRFVIEEGRKRNCKAVRLDTGEKNTPARALYTHLGFEYAGTSNSHMYYELKI